MGWECSFHFGYVWYNHENIARSLLMFITMNPPSASLFLMEKALNRDHPSHEYRRTLNPTVAKDE